MEVKKESQNRHITPKECKKTAGTKKKKIGWFVLVERPPLNEHLVVELSPQVVEKV